MLARCYWIYRVLIAGLAAVLFLVCLGLHVCTMLGVDLYFYAQFLIVGMFLCIHPVALAVGRVHTDVAQLSRDLPWWSFGLLVLLLIYTLVVGPLLSWPSQPMEGLAWRLEDGTYGVFNRSEFLRPCSVEEFYLRQVNGAQHMTRFAMFGCALAFAVVIAAMRSDQQERDKRVDQELVSSLVAPPKVETPKSKPNPKRYAKEQEAT